MLCKFCSQRHKNKSFCSRKCRNEWTRVNNRVNNPVWGKKALRRMRRSLTGKKQSEATKQKRSASLKHFYQQDPQRKLDRVKIMHEKYTSKIPLGWRRIRLKALARDGYVCQICGEANEKKLMVHHLDWRGKRRNVPMVEWNNDLQNLQTVCHKCHNGIHRHKSSDYRERMRLIAP